MKSKAKPIKKQKPAPARAPKSAKSETTVAATAPVVDPLDVIAAEYKASGDPGALRVALQNAYDAGHGARRARAPRSGGPTKRELAAALLRRPQGCTSREILDATGWPAVSVPAIAKASGLTLTQQKDGRTTTYFGKAA
jgi:hypothetical protein